ncbi:MAG: hypothetical protein WC876_08630 [Candidatus Thermoplasmatota archaeon]|jgi:hypothetical protein
MRWLLAERPGAVKESPLVAIKDGDAAEVEELIGRIQHGVD